MINGGPEIRPAHGSFSSRSGSQRIENRLLFRELSGFQLGIDQLTIHSQLEAPSHRRDQLQILHFLLKSRKNFCRQTDGLRLVVSSRAVFQLQMHYISFSNAKTIHGSNSALSSHGKQSKANCKEPLLLESHVQLRQRFPQILQSGFAHPHLTKINLLKIFHLLDLRQTGVGQSGPTQVHHPERWHRL